MEGLLPLAHKVKGETKDEAIEKARQSSVG
jgi:hypothetical protein